MSRCDKDFMDYTVLKTFFQSFADFLYLVECGSRDENGQKTISFNELMVIIAVPKYLYLSFDLAGSAQISAQKCLQLFDAGHVLPIPFEGVNSATPATSSDCHHYGIHLTQSSVHSESDQHVQV